MALVVMDNHCLIVADEETEAQVKELVQDGTSSKWHWWGWDPGSPTLEPRL